MPDAQPPDALAWPQPRAFQGRIGQIGLPTAASFGATETSLPPRFWIAELRVLVFWPLSLNVIAGATVTFYAMFVFSSASISLAGSAEPARL